MTGAATQTPALEDSRPGWNVAVGNFFFKYRNGIFPAIYLLMLFFLRPAVYFGNQPVDFAIDTLGAILAVVGSAIRLLTIGFDYIERGGKEGKVYASFLVRGGVYSRVRNPMYLGNILIAVGLILYAGTPWACVTLIPFFLFVYQAITAAEEAYLRKKFGQDYADYCRRTARFIPSLKGFSSVFSGMTYDWKKALRKEYGTLLVVALLLILLPGWQTYFFQGPAALKAVLPWELWAVGVSFAVYGLIFYLKKAGRLK